MSSHVESMSTLPDFALRFLNDGALTFTHLKYRFIALDQVRLTEIADVTAAIKLKANKVESELDILKRITATKKRKFRELGRTVAKESMNKRRVIFRGGRRKVAKEAKPDPSLAHEDSDDDGSSAAPSHHSEAYSPDGSDEDPDGINIYTYEIGAHIAVSRWYSFQKHKIE